MDQASEQRDLGLRCDRPPRLSNWPLGCNRLPSGCSDMVGQGHWVSPREKLMKRLKITRILSAGIAAGTLLLAAQVASATDDRGAIQGVVNDASGKPVAGAFVKLKNDE